MKKMLTTLVAVFTALGLVSSAEAAKVTVEYAVEGSVFVAGLPAAGTGMVKVLYTTDEALNALPGPARFWGGSLMGSVNIPGLAAVANVFIKDAPEGTFNGTTLSWPDSLLSALITGNTHCFAPALCDAVGLPVSTPTEIDAEFTMLASVITAMNNGASLYVYAFGTLMGDEPGDPPVNLTVRVTGQEIRRYVPEPTQGALLAWGLALLVVIGGVARWRSR